MLRECDTCVRFKFQTALLRFQKRAWGLFERRGEGEEKRLRFFSFGVSITLAVPFYVGQVL